MDNPDIVETPFTEEMITDFGAVAAIVEILVALIAIALLVLIVFSNCKIFKIEGEDWRKRLISLYNSWLEIKIVILKCYSFLIYLVALVLGTTEEQVSPVLSFALILIVFNYAHNLAIKLGKSNGFAVLTAILPIICLSILAFGCAKYDKDGNLLKNDRKKRHISIFLCS